MRPPSKPQALRLVFGVIIAGPGRPFCRRFYIFARHMFFQLVDRGLGGFVESGFNEVTHRAPQHVRSRATSQNPPDSDGFSEIDSNQKYEIKSLTKTVISCAIDGVIEIPACFVGIESLKMLPYLVWIGS